MKKNFPKANEMRKKSSENWKFVNLEAIQEKIEKECLIGNRYAWFLNSRISREDRKYLKQFGYDCMETNFNGVPAFKVAW